jgi:hypothetical protein
MKKFLLGMAAVSALAIGAPAAAQYSNGNNQGRGYGNNTGVEMRVDQLQARLQAGIQSGAVSRQEAVQLRAQLRQLNQLERQYSRDGLSAGERQDLQLRIRNFRQQLRYAEGRGNGQYDNQGRYGEYDNRDDRYGQYDRVDNNRDGYDDRDYDRDGRYDDDVQGGYQGGYGQGGYQQPNQGGLGGILGSILGGNSGLRVGQRASGNLYGLPSQYQGQFRDGNGAYYRTDGRNIYQIDARSQTVVRVYQMNR